MKVRQRPRIAAVILAAGYSSRMQAWKPLLPLGDFTVIDQAIDLFRQSGIDDVVVVAGHRAAELAKALKDRPVRCVINEKYEQGMYESVVTGVRALAADTAAFFLLPVDVPLVKNRTIRLLVRHFAAGTKKILYPAFQGKRGHPPLISTEFVPEIITGGRPDGLRSLLAEYEAAAADVAVLDEGVLLDMDMPEDYIRVQERFRQRGIPSPAECTAILEWMKAKPGTVQHGRQVARTAVAFAVRLNNTGLRLNIPLLEAAGLLHDLAKRRKDHARVGGCILRALGCKQVSELVACHMDLDFSPDSVPDEAALLYLADKVTVEDRFVPLEERVALALAKYADDGPAQAAVVRRLAAARNIEAAVSKISGRQAENMVRMGAD